MMAVFTKKLRKHIFVHPGEKHKLQSSIKNALLKDRKKYSDSLEGALLDVSNIKTIGDRYRIVNGYLSMKVVADFEVFSPSVGMELEGVINKVHGNHYGCLVNDLFNASLSLSHDLNHMTPQEGNACTFVVTKLIVDGALLFMRGNLTSVTPSPDQIEADFNATSAEMTTTTTDTKEGVLSIKLEPDEIDLNELDETPKEKKKKRKKSKKSDDEMESGDLSVKIKKEKKKRQRSEVEEGDAESRNNSTVGEVDALRSNSSPNKVKKEKKPVMGADIPFYSPSKLDQSVTSVNSGKEENKLESLGGKIKKEKRKRRRSEMEDGDTEACNNSVVVEVDVVRSNSSPNRIKKEKKPVIGADIPFYNPSNLDQSVTPILTPSKVKQEPSTPQRKAKRRKLDT